MMIRSFNQLLIPSTISINPRSEETISLFSTSISTCWADAGKRRSFWKRADFRVFGVDFDAPRGDPGWVDFGRKVGPGSCFFAVGGPPGKPAETKVFLARNWTHFFEICPPEGRSRKVRGATDFGPQDSKKKRSIFSAGFRHFGLSRFWGPEDRFSLSKSHKVKNFAIGIDISSDR